MTRSKTAKHFNWRKAWRSAPLLVALFLCAQVLATAHSAAHADVDHLHDGVPCIVTAASKQCETMDTAGPAPTLQQNTIHQYGIRLACSSFENFSASTYVIRGPPQVS